MPILPIDSGRYGSKEMRSIFEDQSRLVYQLLFEAAVAQSQAELKIIPGAAAEDISKVANAGRVTLQRIAELEAVSDHDTAAMVEAMSEQMPASSRPWVHYGLTSADVVDTSMCMQLRDAFKIIETKVKTLAEKLAARAEEFAALPAVGRTHGQHASIVAFGLRFAVWALEMARHYQRMEEAKPRILLCKTLGVVGTGSLMGEKALEVERLTSRSLRLYPVDAATQVIPRERFAEAQFIMALTGSTLDKIAVEIRNLQRTEIAEVAEPFRKGQMGSSAVPVKRNPTKSERVSSLARLLRSLVDVSLENVPLWHERDLSNSANERFTLPLGAILLDEMLNLMIKVVSELAVNRDRIAANLEITRGQIYAEFVLEALVKKGIPRFEAYRDIQRVAFSAASEGSNFLDAALNDASISKSLSRNELVSIFQPGAHLAASGRIIQDAVALVEKLTKNRN